MVDESIWDATKSPIAPVGEPGSHFFATVDTGDHVRSLVWVSDEEITLGDLDALAAKYPEAAAAIVQGFL